MKVSKLFLTPGWSSDLGYSSERELCRQSITCCSQEPESTDRGLGEGHKQTLRHGEAPEAHFPDSYPSVGVSMPFSEDQTQGTAVMGEESQIAQLLPKADADF